MSNESINQSISLSYVQQAYQRSRSLTIDSIDLHTFAISTAASSSSYRTIPLPDNILSTKNILLTPVTDM